MKIQAISAAIAFSLLLTACGGSDAKPTPSPTPSPSPSPNPSPSPTPTPVEQQNPSLAETDDTNLTAQRYQAEAQFVSGQVELADSYISGFAQADDQVIFTLLSNSAQTTDVSIRYANTLAQAQSLALYVNGLYIKQVSLAATGADAWASHSESLTLRAGINTISLISDENNTGKVFIGSIYVAGGEPLAERGATLPYHELEAENLTTNASILAFDTSYGTIAAESSARQAVKLQQQGDYIEFTAPAQSNQLVLRYVIPDSTDGAGQIQSLSVYVDGVKTSVNLSSEHAWVYGSYPYTNIPAQGGAHRFYDEAAFALDIAANTTVRIQKDADNQAAEYIIDLINLEQAPAPYIKPADFIDITTAPYLADATGVADSTQAILAAIVDAKAANTGVWLPAGKFTINNRIDIKDVHIRGAGIWHSELHGTNGKGGFYANGGRNTIADLKITSDAKIRKDSDDHAAFEGNFGKNSLIQSVWVEHMKVGGWFTQGTNGLYLVDGRVRNTYADGFNFHGGVINSQISQFNVRNTGDDAFAMWSEKSLQIKNRNNKFSFNTVQIPTLANGFAIYGGEANLVTDNLVSDTVVSAAGIAISHRFAPHAFSGTTLIERNTLTRTGGWDYGWNTSFGSIWVFTDNSAIDAPIVLRDIQINQATYEGVLVSYNQNVADLQLEDVVIDGAGSWGIKTVVSGGNISLNKVSVSNALSGGMDNSGFAVSDQGNNSGL
ncbi:hypothetical protein ACMZOO_12830 [Catenovulum sp. SX2]|uniref:hypothetical protein n=1 Tax=Catenovulum sp. SX2 TaxID=3398614 RepID=UPI003F868497